jgi:hypothetical protein
VAAHPGPGRQAAADVRELDLIGVGGVNAGVSLGEWSDRLAVALGRPEQLGGGGVLSAVTDGGLPLLALFCRPRLT